MIGCHEGHHDFQINGPSEFFGIVLRGLKDRADLHVINFRRDNSDPASAPPQHRIILAQVINACFDGGE